MTDFVAIRVGDEDFAVPVTRVRDVLRRDHVTPVPLAPMAVAGLINLRGRIVTAIDLRIRLGIAPRAGAGEETYVVVESDAEYYALIVDGVGDVLPIDERRLKTGPVSLDRRWREVATAVYPTGAALIVLLDIERLLDLAPPRRAAS